MRILVLDHSSPVHPVSESRGRPLSVMEKDKEGQRSPDERKSLCNIVDKRNKASKAQLENTDDAANVNKYSQYCPHSQYS